MTARANIITSVTLFATIMGLAIINIMVTSSSVHAQQQQYSFVTKWGSEGYGAGKFKQPLEIALGNQKDVYVTDISSLSNKIQKFTSNGTFITAWGNLGFGPGSFSSPVGI